GRPAHRGDLWPGHARAGWRGRGGRDAARHHGPGLRTRAVADVNQVGGDAVAIGWVSLGGGVGAALRHAVDRAVSTRRQTRAALGGGAGVALRDAVDAGVSTRGRTRFPLGTFLVNLSGSLLLGLVLGLVAGGRSLAVTLVTTGLLAGYTTFSTASVDAVRLLR